MNNPPTHASHTSRRALSISQGNTIQLMGILLGAASIWLSAQTIPPIIRILAMIAGYLLIYFTSHSILHYVIGKLVGIQFRQYSIGGSFHASSYPPLMRTIFARLPFFAVHTHPASMKAAHPTAQALMFISGIIGTVVCCTVATLFSYRAQTPGGTALLVFNLIWQVSSLISEMRPSGDLGKAYQAIRNILHPTNPSTKR